MVVEPRARQRSHRTLHFTAMPHRRADCVHGAIATDGRKHTIIISSTHFAYMDGSACSIGTKVESTEDNSRLHLHTSNASA